MLTGAPCTMGRDEGWTLGDEGNLEEYVLIIIIKMYIYIIIKKKEKKSRRYKTDPPIPLLILKAYCNRPLQSVAISVHV